MNFLDELFCCFEVAGSLMKEFFTRKGKFFYLMMVFSIFFMLLFLSFLYAIVNGYVLVMKPLDSKLTHTFDYKVNPYNKLMTIVSHIPVYYVIRCN